MNKIIDENHICTFCDETEKPELRDKHLYCPTCGMPQFEGVTYNEADDVSILDSDIISN